MLVPLCVDVARRYLDRRVLFLVKFKLIRACQSELLCVSSQRGFRRILKVSLCIFADGLVKILLTVLSDVTEHDDRAGRAILFALLQSACFLLVDSGQLCHLLLLGSSFLG